MTKKQIRMAYEKMDYLEKIERLEFWASQYLSWLNVENKDGQSLMQDVVEYYEEAKNVQPI
jgi:hypothetical protein